MPTWARSTGGCRITGRAIRIRRQLLTTHPEKRFYLLDLAEGLSKLGKYPAPCRRLDRLCGRVVLRVARASWNAGAAASPGDGVLRVRLGTTLIREAVNSG